MYAAYTVTLKTLMDNEQTKPLLEKSLSSYPLYKGKKEYDLIPTREELNQKLLNHYKYRDIGFETVGRFLDELEITMNEIMPRYNERFKTIEIMADLENPFDNVDVTETFQETITGETTNTSNGSTKLSDGSETTTSSNDTSSTDSNVNHNSKHVKSDTPQDDLNITAKNIDGVSYASEVNWNEDNSSDQATTTGTSAANTKTESTQNSENSMDSSGTSKGLTEHTLRRKGNQGVNTYAHDMNEFRTSIIDVVEEIINDKRINELFMLVF